MTQPEAVLSDPEAVLFDMDGTLFDSERLWDVSLTDLAATLGGTLSPDARRRLTGSNLVDTVRIIHADLDVQADPARSADWLLERTRELFAQGVPWRPGARAVVDAVRSRGIPTALVTSSYRALTDTVLDQLDPGTFDAVVCGDEVTHPKPDPESYLTAAARLAVTIDRCVALEDSPRGVASAVAAGCVVVAVPDDPDSLPGGHGAVVSDLGEVTVDGLSSLLAGQRADQGAR